MVTGVPALACTLIYSVPLAYLGAGLLVRANWGEVVVWTLLPRIRWSKESLSVIVAIIGATMSPYFLFWQTSQKVGRRILPRPPHRRATQGRRFAGVGRYARRCARGGIHFETDHVLHHADHSRHTIRGRQTSDQLGERGRSGARADGVPAVRARSDRHWYSCRSSSCGLQRLCGLGSDALARIARDSPGSAPQFYALLTTLL